MTEENVGKYYLVYKPGGDHLYLITKRENGGLLADDLGRYPAAEQGPQGIKGDKGDKGDTGERGPQGIQGLQGPIGRAGAGWNAITSLDASPYTPTFTDGSNDILVETNIDLITNGGTPDAAVKTIDFKFEVPKANVSGYVPTSRTIAGLDLSQNRTASELIEALNVLPVVNVTSSTAVSQYADGKPRIYKEGTNPTYVYIGIIYKSTDTAGDSYFWELESLLTPSRYFSQGWVRLQNPIFDNLKNLTYSHEYALLSDLDVLKDELKAPIGSITIAASDWNNGEATKTISNIGIYDIIQFYPATSTDKTNATNADIFVSASGTTVTFTATTTPTENIKFNFCIIRGMD